MSKFFFKGRKETRQSHIVSGYNVNRNEKAGTEGFPVSVIVQTETRKHEVEQMAIEHAIVISVVVDEAQAENTIELETLINKTTTITFEKKPNRNDVCPCGSGKKYKKCCA
jgi:SWIM/SEC-C metal-binding protein